MRKLVTLLMACIIMGFLQVNCTVFSYFEYVLSVNMYNSTFITEVALVKFVSHTFVICHVVIKNCRKINNMALTFHDPASISVVLKIAEVIQNLKHTHTQTHTHNTCTHLPANPSALVR